MHIIRRDPAKAYIDGHLWVPKRNVNVDGVKNALTFTLADHSGPYVLTLWEETEHHIIVPRAFWKRPPGGVELVDCRPQRYHHVDITSNITLDFKDPSKTTQRDAYAAMVQQLGGILQLRCGGGKTCVALKAIADFKVPAIVIVDTTQLLEQWMKEIRKYLVVPGGVGLIQAGKFDWKKALVMSTYQTLAARADELPEEVRRWFGVAIWDEAHGLSAPTFSKTAPLFYGRRYGLTATADREDGTHVIYNHHLGRVFYRNLKQPLTPKNYFYWTGIHIDQQDAATRQEIVDCRGEVHISKLSTYLARDKERLQLIIAQVRQAVAAGRRCLVLAKTVDGCVNLLATWLGVDDLHNDVPMPTREEVGWEDPTTIPDRLDSDTLNKLRGLLDEEDANRAVTSAERATIEERLRSHDLACQLDREWEKRHATYRRMLLDRQSDAGLMIRKVKLEERVKFIDTKQVIFAIMKYGRQALDIPRLDTIYLTDPVSDPNLLQQILGRALRDGEEKNEPMMVVFEDDVGEFIGMCRKMRKHLREWPIEDGGPYQYEIINRERGE